MGEISFLIDISFLLLSIVISFVKFVHDKKSQKLLKFSAFLNTISCFLPSARTNDELIRNVFFNSIYVGRVFKNVFKKSCVSKEFCINDFLVICLLSKYEIGIDMYS